MATTPETKMKEHFLVMTPKQRAYAASTLDNACIVQAGGGNWKKSVREARHGKKGIQDRFLKNLLKFTETDLNQYAESVSTK